MAVQFAHLWRTRKHRLRLISNQSTHQKWISIYKFQTSTNCNHENKSTKSTIDIEFMLVFFTFAGRYPIDGFWAQSHIDRLLRSIDIGMEKLRKQNLYQECWNRSNDIQLNLLGQRGDSLVLYLLQMLIAKVRINGLFPGLNESYSSDTYLDITNWSNRFVLHKRQENRGLSAWKVGKLAVICWKCL